MNRADFEQDRPNSRCDYSDWQFESINFQWIPSKGVWMIYAYDINEVFDGTIEGRPITRCVCGDSQFTHYMIENRVKVPIKCPMCNPEPTPKPDIKIVVVHDMWAHEANSWGCHYFIHAKTCKHVHEISRFKNHSQREVYEGEYEPTKEGIADIGMDWIGDQMRERDEHYNEDGTFDEEKARATAYREVEDWAKCKCMDPYMDGVIYE